MANSLYGSVIWVPSDPTGATNMAPELEELIESNPGKPIIMAPGSTVLFSTTFGSTFTSLPLLVDVDFSGGTILQNNDTPAIILDNTGNASSEVTASLSDTYLHSNQAPTTQVTLTTSLSLQSHDYIAIYSEDTITGMGCKAGEIAQIMDDEASLVVNTAGKLSLTSKFTTTIRCRKLDATHKVRLKNGIIKSNGDADSESITVREEAIKIMGYVDPVIDGFEFDGPWAICQWFQCCAHPVAKNYTVKNTKNMGAFSGFTYGAYVYGMNYGAHFHKGLVRNGRHAGATTGGSKTGSSTWYSKGYPTLYLFEDIVSYNSYGVPFDSHEHGVDGVWKNCTSFNHVIDRDSGGIIGKAFNSRAFRETFDGIYSVGGSAGGQVANTDFGELNTIHLKNINIKNVYHGDGGANAIEFDGVAEGRMRVVGENISIKDVDRGFNINANVEFIYDGLKVSGADYVGLVRAGAKVTGKNSFFDFSTSVHSANGYCWMMYADTADSSVRMLDKPVVIMKGAGIPREFFGQSGTITNNCYTYHPGLIVNNNYDGGGPYTATLSKKSGGTFVDLTDVTEVTL